VAYNWTKNTLPERRGTQFVCDGCGQAIFDRGIVVPKDGTCFCNTDCETKHEFDKMEQALKPNTHLHDTSS
jgi:hypothetical protein